MARMLCVPAIQSSGALVVLTGTSHDRPLRALLLCIITLCLR